MGYFFLPIITQLDYQFKALLIDFFKLETQDYYHFIQL